MPGTLDAREVAEIKAFELRAGAVSLGHLPLTPAPVASFDAEGGFKALPVYSWSAAAEDQLQEMAQFAVNVVDALDPDSNITLFEYDKDLSDGWNLDDNPYDATNDPIASKVDRGLLYGVERQQLCLNESMVTLYQPCINTVTNLAQGHPDI